MQRLILKLFLIFVISSQIVFAFSACENKKETVAVEYEYENKDMNKKEEKPKTDENGRIFNNKTTEKEFLNFYIVLNSLFSKFKIDSKELKPIKELLVSPRQELKLSGHISFDLTKEQKEHLKDALKKDWSKIEVKSDEFLKFKKEVIEILKNRVKKIKGYSEETRKIEFGTIHGYEEYLDVLLKRIKKFESIKFEDVEKLTKDLKMKNYLKEFKRLLP